MKNVRSRPIIACPVETKLCQLMVKSPVSGNSRTGSGGVAEACTVGVALDGVLVSVEEWLSSSSSFLLGFVGIFSGVRVTVGVGVEVGVAVFVLVAVGVGVGVNGWRGVFSVA